MALPACLLRWCTSNNQLSYKHDHPRRLLSGITSGSPTTTLADIQNNLCSDALLREWHGRRLDGCFICYDNLQWDPMAVIPCVANVPCRDSVRWLSDRQKSRKGCPRKTKRSFKMVDENQRAV